MAKSKAPKPRIEGAAAQQARVETPEAPEAKVSDEAKEVPAQAAPESSAQPKPKTSPKPKVAVSVAPEQENQAEERVESSEGAGPAPAKPSGRNPAAWFSGVFPGHEHAVMGGVAGLIVALLVFIIGFWQTVFVCLLVVLGVAFGQYLDGDPKIIDLVRRFVAGGQNDEDV